MLKSMTGFGRGEYLDAEYRFVAEVKAVNHRYNEIVIRMPKNLGSLEDKIRKTVAGTLQRGRIDVFVAVDEYGEKNRAVRVDKDLAIAYHKALKELGELLDAPNGNDANHIARYPDVLRVEETATDVEGLWPKMQAALEAAVQNLMAMRLAEGANIEQDMVARIDAIAGHVAFVGERAPQVLSEYREKLLGRMRDLLAAVGAEPDEGRLLQEAAMYADRISITEELVRLQSHLKQFKVTLTSGEAVGRKLDFIVQEMNRETNTIASKANDFAVANVVVEIKSEIEKVREQIQNIE
ncbi:MAG TPA: YicC/YloC family endoribonuclease [Negativicutes bacterium]|nr:YicC/YloC family endoribonuclease [Negativicutes bacterium]